MGVTTDKDHAGALAGVRVLDLTVSTGRYAGKVLAECGADVVRLRQGERGPDLTTPDEPGLLDWWHDNRCRIAPLNLDDSADVGLFRQLVECADVLIEAEAPGAMATRGLGPSALAELNPQLVHVSVTPQGSDGPRSGWQSSDLVAQALGGYLSVTGDADHPVQLWGRQAATVSGLYTAISALAGLQRARHTGRGSWVDLSQHEALVACSEHLLMYWWFADALAPLGAPVASRQRSLHWIRAFEVVPCKRGACMVSPAAGGLLGLIAWLKGRGYATEVPDDPDAETLLTLVEPLMQALRDCALEMDATELCEAGQSLHVPFGESYSIAQVAACAQHEHRRFFSPVEGHDKIRIPGPLAHFERSPAPAATPPETTSPDAVLQAWTSQTAAAVSTTSADTASSLSLAGLRVLDFTHVLAGPFATRTMADLGADVIRVQTEARNAGSAANEFPYNVLWARTKRSIQLEMKHPEALKVLRQLVEQADVVVDNFSAGVMSSWGAGPEQLAEWNPRVVSMSMSGCGEEGPWQDYVTYAPTVHALCGFTALTGPAGESDCGPGIAYNDHISGLAGAIALLSALHHRDQVGVGQHIEMSQLEVGTYLVGPALVDYFATGREAKAAGNVDPFTEMIVNDVFRSADDEWVAITIADGEAWNRATALGIADRSSKSEAIAAWASQRTAVEAQHELQAAGVASGKVQTARDWNEADPQLAHRDWLVTMPSEMVGTQTTERHPARWYSDGLELTLPYEAAPYLGQHNFEVLEELLGWDAGRVAEAIGDELLM